MAKRTLAIARRLHMGKCTLAIAVSTLISISVAASNALPDAPRIPSIVVDTDMGLDDARAVFALVADTASAVHAFITVEGSASIGRGTDNLIGLLESTGAHGIPVYRGIDYPDRTPPPWRKTADALAGHPFPPPRSLTAPHATAEVLLGPADEKHILYLALGPLGNLASLEAEYPGIIGRIASLWLPASIDGNRVDAWNLSFDGESALAVIQGARDVVLVDVRGISDARSLLEKVEGTSAAARWITELLSDADGHLMICDELAALASIRPHLIEMGTGRYRLECAPRGDFLLESAADGNVRIARLADTAAAAEQLVRLWEQPAHHDHPVPDRAGTDAAALLKAFHGHLGPYVVLGYRMGCIALGELGSAGHFGIAATVHSELAPPRSCLIDGIQLGSGCTLGKRNIEVRETEGPAFAEFEGERGVIVTIRLRKNVPRLIDELIENSGVEAAGALLLEMDATELFEVQRLD
jgi:formylmethanofuran dehydrogenase subunit E